MTIAVHSPCKDSAVEPLLGPIVTVQTEHTKGVLSICTTPTVLQSISLSMCSLANSCSLQQKMLVSSNFL